MIPKKLREKIEEIKKEGGWKLPQSKPMPMEFNVGQIFRLKGKEIASLFTVLFVNKESEYCQLAMLSLPAENCFVVDGISFWNISFEEFSNETNLPLMVQVWNSKKISFNELKDIFSGYLGSFSEEATKKIAKKFFLWKEDGEKIPTFKLVPHENYFGSLGQYMRSQRRKFLVFFGILSLKEEEKMEEEEESRVRAISPKTIALL